MIVPQTHLEVAMATHCSVLAWRIPTDRAAWRATVHGVPKSQTQLKRLTHTHTHTHTHTQNCLDSPVKSKTHNGQPNGTMSSHIIGKRRVTWQRPRSSKPMTLTRLPTVRLASSAGSTSATILSRDGCPYQYFVTLLNSPPHLGWAHLTSGPSHKD